MPIPPMARGAIRVSLRQEGDDFVLQVEDDGCGMPADGAIKGTGLGSKLVGAMATTLDTRSQRPWAG
jgi:two-component sensor histidine kinase